MKSRDFLASLVAAAISIFALTGGEQPRQSKSDDLKKVNQAREEELERSSATLMGRCRRMLERQIAVHNGTKSLQKVIQGTPDKKPRTEDQQASLKLAANEKDLVIEATKTIEMLEAEVAVVAIPEVFRELRKDMKRVERRLKISDVGMDTQAIEQDILDILREMIAALKKR